MKRFHVHLSVPDLDSSVAFYSRLFGTAPTVTKSDYAKWMLDDPRVNFALSSRGAPAGLNHLGLQADDDAELAQIGVQFARADAGSVIDETGVACCYARSNKHWVTDPQGIAWEAFHSFDTVPLYAGPEDAAADDRCCAPGEASAPAKAAQPGCCGPQQADTATATSARCCS